MHEDYKTGDVGNNASVEQGKDIFSATINFYFNRPADVGSGVSDLPKKHIIQKPVIFRGEKPTFIGRQEHVDKIREYLKRPGIRLSLVGLGGTGKTALAYKAIHKSEDLFDSIIPIYFDSNLTLDEFLLKVAENFKDIQLEDFKKESVDKRIEILLNILGRRDNNNPRTLILADNYDTISGVLNRDNSNDYNNDNSSSRPQTPKNDLVKINDFLNTIPTDSNTSIIATSRERERNLDGETTIEIVGLRIDEGKELFRELANDRYISHSYNIQKAIEDIVEKTGGHPLSIEILARSYRGLGIKEIRNMSETLRLGAVNPRQPEERLKSLKSSFDYSLTTLDKDIRDLIYKLIFFFNPPFPLSAVTEIFGATEISGEFVWP